MPAYPALMLPSLGCRPVAVPCAGRPLAAMSVVRRFAVAGAGGGGQEVFAAVARIAVS